MACYARKVALSASALRSTGCAAEWCPPCTLRAAVDASRAHAVHDWCVTLYSCCFCVNRGQASLSCTHNLPVAAPCALFPCMPHIRCATACLQRIQRKLAGPACPPTCRATGTHRGAPRQPAERTGHGDCSVQGHGTGSVSGITGAGWLHFSWWCQAAASQPFQRLHQGSHCVKPMCLPDVPSHA